MHTVYIYLFKGRHSEEHINYMEGMIDSLAKAADLADCEGTFRADLQAWEWKVTATMWTYNFLHYMRSCDMIEVFNNQL